MFKVAIDAGHGFNTPGKRTPDGEREWSFNDKVVRAFIEAMNQYEGVTVKRFDDPTGKTDVPLNTRTNGANSWGANIFISYHHNANTGKWGTWTGSETFTYLGSQPSSEKLAACVHPEIVKAYGLKDRGLKKANFHIVRETKMPAILVEGGYMDSTTDIKKLRSDQVLKNAGYGMAAGVAKYAGLKKKANATTPTTSQPTPTVNPYQIGVATINVDNLNVYKGPGANYQVIGKLARGKAYKAYDLQNGWYNLGGDQWVDAKSVKFAPIAQAVTYETHKVTSGDTLWSISRKYGVTVDEIKSLNSLKTDTLSIGTVLKVKKK